MNKTIRPLPEVASDIFKRLGAPARLVRHHEVVHECACRLAEMLKKEWPVLQFSNEEISLGAAIHDIGKIRFPGEITGRGNKHEKHGPAFAKEAGLVPPISDYASLHKIVEKDDAPWEVMIVALADMVWRGSRTSADKLESRIVRRIANATQKGPWEVWGRLDEIVGGVAGHADYWLEYCR